MKKSGINFLRPYFFFLSMLLVAAPGRLIAQTPPNDLCADAASVACATDPFGVSGNNTGATPTSAPSCSGVTPGSNAVWYSIIGNGGLIQLDTCSPLTNFDTRISVYTGDCSNEAGMSCVVANDDAAGSPPECELGGNNLLSRLSWTSISGVEYLIIVSGLNSASGDFELTLSCEVPVELQGLTIE